MNSSLLYKNLPIHCDNNIYNSSSLKIPFEDFFTDYKLLLVDSPLFVIKKATIVKFAQLNTIGNIVNIEDILHEIKNYLISFNHKILVVLSIIYNPLNNNWFIRMHSE